MTKFENLIPYRNSMKWGFADKHRKVKVPCVYDYVCPYDGLLAAVEVSSLWGAVNFKGQLIIPCVYQHMLVFTEGVAAGTRDGKLYEYICEDGNLLTNPVFEFCGQFKNGMAIVSYEGKYGVINRNMDAVIEPSYDDLERYGEKTYRYKLDGYWGLINDKEEILVSAEYDEIAELNCGRAVVQKTVTVMAPHMVLDEDGDCLDVDEVEMYVERYGIVDAHGNLIMACEKEQISTFSEGVAIVSSDSENDYELGLIDLNGQDILGFTSSGIRDHSAFGTIVLKNNKWGAVTAKGQWIVDARYDELTKLDNDFYMGAFLSDDQRLLTWDYMDAEGTIITSVYDYEHVGAFIDGRALIIKNGKYGYINLKGEIVVAPQFDSAHAYHGKMAKVKKGKWGFIDQSGNVIIDCKYDVLGNFIDGFAEVRDWSESGYGTYCPNDFHHPGFWNVAELSDDMDGDEIPWQPLKGYINTRGEEFFEGDFAHASSSY